MMPWGRKGGVPSMSGGDPRFKYTSYYKDTTLFYNFYTDTVFTVTPTSLMPRWVVELDEDYGFLPGIYMKMDCCLNF